MINSRKFLNRGWYFRKFHAAYAVILEHSGPTTDMQLYQEGLGHTENLYFSYSYASFNLSRCW